ncbi:MAG: hypothetical protein LBF16_06660 [Pseudomonadales bacterium]|jgi:hypothetical protein|nr:hypothetical protein [Pseudomonadales bacterium]
MRMCKPIAAGIATVTVDEKGIGWQVEKRQGLATSEPLFAVVIDRNLGQDVMTDAALGIPVLGKSGEERWVRRSGGIFGGEPQHSYTVATGPLKKVSGL